MNRRQFIRILGTATLLFGVQSTGKSCGVEWQVPANHFEYVNERGEFSYWRELDRFQTVDDGEIPLIVGFRPKRGSSASLAQRGWTVTVFDSNIVQVDEKRFLLTQPDGIVRQFWRKTVTDAILEGQGGWKGFLEEGATTIWAPCGWKLFFKKGRIVSFTTPKNRTFYILAFNGRASELQENGKTLLKCDINPENGLPSSLSYGSKRITLETTQRPRVEPTVAGNVVTGLENAIGRIGLPDGSFVAYEFSVDSRVQPTLKISEKQDRIITWDAANGRILADGDWTYRTQENRVLGVNASVARQNSDGRTESWLFDAFAGVETVRSGGRESVKKWFTEGVLAGKKRSEELWDANRLVHSVRWSYDELGVLQREVDNQIERSFDQSGRLVSIGRAGVLLWKINYSESGEHRALWMGP